MGDLGGAKAAYERALKIDEAAYGSEHPSVTRDVNNLGGVLGDLAGAKAAFERALKIDEALPAARSSQHQNCPGKSRQPGLIFRLLGLTRRMHCCEPASWGETSRFSWRRRGETARRGLGLGGGGGQGSVLVSETATAFHLINRIPEI